MSQAENTALVIIDIQNDYFPDGRYPLWNTETVLNNIEVAVQQAQAKGMPVVLIQHIARPAVGLAPFFNAETEGVKLHANLLAEAPNAPVVIKSYADSFLDTELTEVLTKLAVSKLLICGMMTQNCVTHTAISPAAAPYQVSILSDCCTSVDNMIHQIALNGVAPRVPLVKLEDVFS
ncbi:Nicotinamidase-related amidase [Oceanospirillum multiglobuliferum]|uniref:Cysteine hydrolase n=1 Tax=Oceanospirillum multiglobuliferum TaxID=64969 RepID=A0A1T4QX20_9GAMM|nr:cysteine hydrolase family protein [Oceanospirillum multiglobuliferum]OPX57080.1 cysteine hydrolase [Oceanospirillum multiglobuliferum]SKA08313.1 Nicotinamidase-related amidase [Oceanospirillum multiglobuliferum]